MKREFTQKEHFDDFIEVLAERFEPLYIYCFGTAAQSSKKTGCFIDHVDEESNRYFLLMITESSTRIEHEVQNYVNDHFHHGTITALVHGKETLIEAVRSNSKFFITVANNAELIYSKDSTIKSFQVPAFIPTQAAIKAKKHHNHRQMLATGFLESALECIHKGKHNLAAFMLHQVVEQSCIALIRVHLAYRSDIHNLYRLLRLCDSFSPAISGFFLDESEEGRRLFDILAKSYSGARYKDDFCVGPADATRMYYQVAAFLRLTTALCNDKIDSLAIEAEVYKQLQKEREVVYG